MSREVERIFEEDEGSLARRTAEIFFRVAEELLSEEERVVVSLPGGSSIRPFYGEIPERAELLEEEQWERLHFFWTDERLVPPDSPESNYRLARELFLDDLLDEGLIGRENVHRFPGETADPEEALEAYSSELRRVSDGRIHLPVLGVGSDGHVGSLFPDGPGIRGEGSDFLLVENSPKPPAERVTVSPRAIEKSDYPFLFFIGEEKREAYRCFRDREKSHLDCPCKLALAGDDGTAYVVTDLKE